MNKSFKQIPISELRVKLPKLRRQVQSGNLCIVCTHYGEVVAFLLPLQDIYDINSEAGDISIEKTKEIPLTEFRDQLNEAWESLVNGTDCIFLTFHKRRVLAFLSPRFIRCLSLPLIGDPDKVFLIYSQTLV